jgi:hypothetical protein
MVVAVHTHNVNSVSTICIAVVILHTALYSMLPLVHIHTHMLPIAYTACAYRLQRGHCNDSY